MIPDRTERMVEVAVRITADGVESLYGGSLPKLRIGTVGSLVVPAFAFGSEEELQAYTRELTVPLLAAGDRLLVSVAGAPLSSKGLYQRDEREVFPPGMEPAFVELVLVDPLELTLRGSKRATLRECRCQIPTLPEESPESVNQAYTVVSRAFEPRRRSHSGNVFRKVFWRRTVKDGTRHWLPLEELRRPREAAIEERVRALAVKKDVNQG